VIWPDSVAPFDVGLINLRQGDAACDGACEDAYAALAKTGKEVLYDDREDRPGAKFAGMDLIGLPWQLIIGPKGLAEGTVELKRRATGEREVLSLEAALNRLTA
jgi:prolyl-tRNA synthetase